MADPRQPVYSSPRSESHLRNILFQLRKSLDSIVVDISDLENALLREGTASVALTSGDIVYAPSSGNFNLAQANSAVTSRVAGIVVADAAMGATALVLVTGSLMRAAWGLSTNSFYYLSPTVAGAITTTAPTAPGQYVVQLGVAISTEILTFLPKQSILL